MQPFLDQLLNKYHSQATELLQILIAIQSHYHFINDEAITYLAKRLQLPLTAIRSVIDFYSFLHFTPRGKYEILFSNSITDIMAGSKQLQEHLCKKLDVQPGKTRQDNRLSIDETSCTGLSDQGPALLINGYAIGGLNPDKLETIAALIEKNQALATWPRELFQIKDNIQKADLLLLNSITPGAALKKTFSSGIDITFQEISRSALRGRGGGGFSTASKWLYCQQANSQQKVVVCNADEGEPGTFKDRVLLNSYAHQVIEGMTVCAAIIGASRGFIYLRGEYLFLYRQLQNILQNRRNNGLLGANILGQNLSFDISIHLGAGAYICGEESALLESLEGKPGIPRNRPPYPVENGYLQKPTVVNNVETFFAAAYIATNGADTFLQYGNKRSTGTKLLSISGDCQYPGIYEYPFGTTITKILHDCGAENTYYVQIGGPSGSCATKTELGRTLSFEDLATGGSFMVFNHQRKPIDMVKNFTAFFAHESCGFCTPCRVGTSLLLNSINNLKHDCTPANNILELTQLCQLITKTSHCGLGQTAANPILTTLSHFPEQYQLHLNNAG